MKFECRSNPNHLINAIGNAYFSIADGEDKHFDHPQTIRIIDCEGESYIDVHSSLEQSETYRMAGALVRLLNQDYIKLEIE